MRTIAKESDKVPFYLNELKNLSNDEKLQIIMFLSSSMMDSHKVQKPSERYTKEMLDRFSGAWVGEETAEEIINNINKSKKSHSEPVSLL